MDKITNKFRSSKTLIDSSKKDIINSSATRKSSENFQKSFTLFNNEVEKSKENNYLQSSRRKQSCPINIPSQSFNIINDIDKKESHLSHNNQASDKRRRFSLQYGRRTDHIPILPKTNIPPSINESNISFVDKNKAIPQRRFSLESKKTYKNLKTEMPSISERKTTSGSIFDFIKARKSSRQKVDQGNTNQSIDSPMTETKTFPAETDFSKSKLPIYMSHLQISPKSNSPSSSNGSPKRKTSKEKIQPEKKQSIVQMFEKKILIENTEKEKSNQFYKKKSSLIDTRPLTPEIPKRSFSIGSGRHSNEQRRARKKPIFAQPKELIKERENEKQVSVIPEGEEEKEELTNTTTSNETVSERKNADQVKEIDSTIFRVRSSTVLQKEADKKMSQDQANRRAFVIDDTIVINPQEDENQIENISLKEVNHLQDYTEENTRRKSKTENNSATFKDGNTDELISNQSSSVDTYTNNIQINPFKLENRVFRTTSSSDSSNKSRKLKKQPSFDDYSPFEVISSGNLSDNDFTVPTHHHTEILSTDKVLKLTREKLEQSFTRRKETNRYDDNFDSNDLPMNPLTRTYAIDSIGYEDLDYDNDSGSVSSKAYSDPSSPVDKKISVIENPLRRSDVLKLPDGSNSFKKTFMQNYIQDGRLDGDSGIDDGFLKFIRSDGSDKPLSLKDVPAETLISDRRDSVCSSVVATEYNYDNNGANNEKVDENDRFDDIQVIRRRKTGATASLVSLDEIPKNRRFSRVESFHDMSALNEYGSADSFESSYMTEGISKRLSKYSPLVAFDTTDGTEIVADSETRDIISDSNDTISLCSGVSRPQSMYYPKSFNKNRIEEEPEEFPISTENNEMTRKESSTASVDSSCSNSTIHDDDDITPEKVIKEYHEKLNGSKSHTPESNSKVHTPEQQEKKEIETEIDAAEIYSTQKLKDEIPPSPILTATNTPTDSITATNTPTDSIFFEKKLNANESKSTTFSTMFGYFNYSLYNFISKAYGLEKWKEIISSLDLHKKQIAMFERPKHSMFDDAVTDLVLKTASKKLNCNFNLFLQKFGTSYFEFCCSKYGDILKSLATNLGDFINNMDDIRRHIHKIEKIEDQHPPSIYALLDRRGTLLLYYYSQTDQKCLEYFLIGFIKSAALVLYGLRSRVSLQQQRKDNNDYSIIAIKAVNSLVKKPSISKLQVSTKCKDLIIEPHLMDDVLPFHMILNEKLDICQLGSSLNRLLENYIDTHGVNLKNYFEIAKPKIDFSYSSIKTNLNTAFIMTSKPNMFTEVFNTGLTLKGQILFLESSNCLWFVASPKVEEIGQLSVDNNLYLSDIPIHDATRQVLLVNERTNAQDSLKNQLQVLTNRLKETSKELALGKINTENILDEIFPKDVAEKLMRDLPVPAVTAEEVTILFTDIVGFTAICGKSDPEEVTHMLNKLYLQFDNLCEKHEIYKVETIGDAYMAVGGLHRKDKEHGRSTTLMGISMVQAANKVQTPEGENIQIRVGIHSGSVVAGVVGTVMPRYCLFGNDVTLANKMESTSVDGKVHISPATYLAIKHHEEFIFFERPRDVLPPLMLKQYAGYSYFVTQRRLSTYERPIVQQTALKNPYMKDTRMFEDSLVRRAPSRKTSYTESVYSDTAKYPANLREQLRNLEIIDGYTNGKSLMLPRFNQAVI